MTKAIETEFKGRKFRSRTEARWAVFLDALGFRFEYEKEAFSLPSGGYLPDFWVPEWGYWIEVKGEPPGLHELRIFRELPGKKIMLIGDPDPENHVALFVSDADEIGPDNREQDPGYLSMEFELGYMAECRRVKGAICLAGSVDDDERCSEFKSEVSDKTETVVLPITCGHSVSPLWIPEGESKFDAIDKHPPRDSYSGLVGKAMRKALSYRFERQKA